MSDTLAEWRSGTGRIIRPGDTVWVDNHTTVRYRVNSLKELPDGTIEATLFGGRRNREAWRTFDVTRLHRKLTRPNLRSTT